MKKILFLFYFILLCYVSDAQFSIVGEVGYTSSNMILTKNVNFKPDFSNLNTMYISIIPKFNLALFSAAIELSLQNKGYVYSASNNIIAEKISYISISPQIGYSLLGIVTIYTGLDVGYIVNEQLKHLKEDWKNIKDYKLLSPREDKYDIAIPIGLRIRLKKLQISTSINFGVRDINPYSYTDSNGNTIQDIKGYHRYFKLGIGYQLI